MQPRSGSRHPGIRLRCLQQGLGPGDQRVNRSRVECQVDSKSLLYPINQDQCLIGSKLHVVTRQPLAVQTGLLTRSCRLLERCQHKLAVGLLVRCESRPHSNVRPCPTSGRAPPKLATNFITRHLGFQFHHQVVSAKNCGSWEHLGTPQLHSPVPTSGVHICMEGLQPLK